MNERVIKSLDYLGLDHNTEVEESECSKNTYIVNDTEYLVLTDEEADEARVEYLENFLDDCGIAGFSKFGQEYILENCVDTRWFDEAMRESYESYVSDIREELSSSEGFETRLEEEMAEADCEDEESYIDYLCSQYDDATEWYRENFGEMDFSEVVKEYCSMEIDKISEFCKEQDCRGHSLATYDGRELDLGDDYYAYRMN